MIAYFRLSSLSIMELIKRKKKEMHKDVASKHQEYVTGLLCHITTNYYVTSQQTSSTARVVIHCDCNRVLIRNINFFCTWP